MTPRFIFGVLLITPPPKLTEPSQVTHRLIQYSGGYGKPLVRESIKFSFGWLLWIGWAPETWLEEEGCILMIISVSSVRTLLRKQPCIRSFIALLPRTAGACWTSTLLIISQFSKFFKPGNLYYWLNSHWTFSSFSVRQSGWQETMSSSEMWSPQFKSARGIWQQKPYFFCTDAKLD